MEKKVFPKSILFKIRLIKGKQSISRKKGSSEQEHREDALASGAEEGRDKLRKASVSGKYANNRGCPNGETRLSNTQSTYGE